MVKMGGSTFKCNKCENCIRVSSLEEFEEYQQEHNKTCDGKFESLWKDYDKMTKEVKEKLIKKVIFRHGELGKLEELDEDVKEREEVRT
jgi:hypothetical protein